MMNRLATAVLAFLFSALPGAGSASGDPETAAERPPDLSRSWWNQPRHVETLGLTEEQRERMDELLAAHLEERRELAAAYRQARHRLGDHLAEGGWEAAREAAGRASEKYGAIARGETELAIAAIRLLEAGQRATLDEEFPMLLRRSWVQGRAKSSRGRFRGRDGR